MATTAPIRAIAGELGELGEQILYRNISAVLVAQTRETIAPGARAQRAIQPHDHIGKCR